MRPRIYVDTSVIGGCLDTEFREHSLALVRDFAEGHATMLVSALTLAELALAPSRVRAVLDEIPDERIEPLQLSDEAAELATAYLEADTS